MSLLSVTNGFSQTSMPCARCSKLFNLRSDPFETADREGMDYKRWRLEHAVTAPSAPKKGAADAPALSRAPRSKIRVPSKSSAIHDVPTSVGDVPAGVADRHPPNERQQNDYADCFEPYAVDGGHPSPPRMT